VQSMGVVPGEPGRIVSHVMVGRQCRECGNSTVIRKDGCDFCTSCGAIGSCG